MSSIPQKEQVAVVMSVEADYSVRPIENEGIIPVDGPVVESSAPSFDSHSSFSEAESSDMSEHSTSSSSINSPKSGLDGGSSETSFEEGEITKIKLERPEDAKHEAVEAGNEVTESGDKLDVEPEVKGANVATIDQGLAEILDGKNHGVEETQHTAKDAEIVSIIEVKPVEDIVVEAEHEQSTDIKVTQEVAYPDLTPGDSRNNTAASNDEPENAASEPSKPYPAPRSLPPHLRPRVQPTEPGHAGLEISKYSKTTADGQRYDLDAPRAPRAFQPPIYSPRYYDSGGTVARLQAHIMKVEKDLSKERIKNAKLRQTLEIEHQKEMDSALSSMTMELVRKQGKAIAQQTRFENMYRDLQDRAKNIEQLEYYLSVGQKYLNDAYEAEEGERRVLYDMTRREHEYHLSQLKLQKIMADREGELSMRAQAIHNRESAQMMREQQFVAINRKTIEAELRETIIVDMDDRLAEVADTEYNSGFGAGKAAGRKEAEEESRQNGFLEGYAACHRTQVVLSNMRAGRIAHDSPELAFLLDPGHPHNAFTMGTRIGHFEGEKQFNVQEKKPVIVKNIEVMAEEKKDVEVAEEEDNYMVKSKFTQSYMVEESLPGPVRKMPVPRPTFASELRTTAPAMHNGEYVLANSAGSKVTTQGEDVYAGRRVIKYEDSEEGNLIDLY